MSPLSRCASSHKAQMIVALMRLWGAAAKTPSQVLPFTRANSSGGGGSAVFTDGVPEEICLACWQRLRVACKRR